MDLWYVFGMVRSMRFSVDFLMIFLCVSIRKCHLKIQKMLPIPLKSRCTISNFISKLPSGELLALYLLPHQSSKFRHIQLLLVWEYVVSGCLCLQPWFIIGFLMNRALLSQTGTGFCHDYFLCLLRWLYGFVLFSLQPCVWHECIFSH